MRFRVAPVVGIALAFAVSIAGCSAGGPEEAPDPQPEVAAQPAQEAPPPEPTIEELAAELVAGQTLRENIGGIIMANTWGSETQNISDFLTENSLGGHIFMGTNIPYGPEELRALTDSVRGDPAFPLLLGIDEEGGVVTRLWWDDYLGAADLKYLDPAETNAAFSGRAGILRDSGLNLNFGIVADVTDDDWSFIYERALGQTPAEAAARVTEAVRGERGIVSSTLKHFPGHGAAPGDSHWQLPTSPISLDEWRGFDAVPFKAGIDEGAELVMFGHIVFEAVDSMPASLSGEWHRILRDELGFTGVAITDDLGMLLNTGDERFYDITEIAWQALMSGNDILLFVGMDEDGMIGQIIDSIEARATDDPLARERIVEAATRVAVLRLSHGDH